MATSDSLLPLFDHTHDLGTTALTVLTAAFAAFYAAWLWADVLPRLVVFGIAALVVSFALYRQPDTRGVVAGVFYALAALLLLTPIALNLTVIVTAGMPGVTDPWARILTMTDLKIFLGFAVVAAILAGIGYYLNNTAAVRSRLSNITES